MKCRFLSLSLRGQLAIVLTAAFVVHAVASVACSYYHASACPPCPVVYKIVYCAGILAFIFFLVNKMATSLARLTASALEFGRNPNRQPIKLPEQGTDEVRQAAIAFNSMQKQIQNLLHERDDMLTALAHDIRTPLARLQIAVELIEDERLKDRLLRNMAEISSILDKGMSLSKYGLSSEEPIMLDIVSFLERICEEMAQNSSPLFFQDRTEGDERVCVLARMSGLEICLRNLVSNAVAYGAPPVGIMLSADSVNVYVDVLDSGPGIPDCCIERVMRPFYRMDLSRNKASGGLGLGLTIAQNSAALDGGVIRLSNRSEGGVQARLTLPRYAAER